ncbi:MAG: Fe-S cluster-binding ribosome biosynthesis protein [Chaenotheca gracillima]|nr:MAG: Fe-S cluster-binding ribosome biosynthesis protein [Chaenotheca gracillima]
MNAPNGVPAPAGLWQEARNADGRVYYYNTQTKATQWTKPLDLMTPAERALANQPWKEYTAEGGRKYWYNTETKSSSWEIPQAYKDALAQQSIPQKPPPPSQTFVAGGASSFPPYQHHQQSQHFESGHSERQGGYGRAETNGDRGGTLSQQDPEYASFEEAESAFLKLLKRAGVQPEWSWEQAMRAIIKDPQYRALKDPKDRKSAFEKYAVEVRVQEKDRAKERLAKLQTDFGTMLRRHPEIKHYTRWKTARPIIEGETIFRSTNDDNERRQLFEEYIIELKKANVEREAVTRKAAMDELVSILKALDLEPYTRWSEAQGVVQTNDRFQEDEKFQSLSKSDILTAFENHIKSLERSFNDSRQQEKNLKVRRERQNRDNYIGLLKELKVNGKIKAGSKWMQVLPLIENDERYTAILGQSGSTPLDLFWDVVEEEERGLRGRRNEILDVLDDKRYEIQAKTTFEDFLSVVDSDRRTAHIDKDILRLIFERLREKVIRRSEDDKHQAERQQRRAVDALRSKIKHLEPPVLPTDTWDEIRPRIEAFEEYRSIESDDLRRSAFEKVLRRLKEKDEDAERERGRREKDRGRREPSYRDRGERERDRDPRNGYSSVRSRRVRASRTPEADAYEADRRKAQADRERLHHKGGPSAGPGSPRQRGERFERGDRDKDRDRARERGTSRPLTHYDRERRDREEERERLYRTRGDPKSAGDELDYGDSGRSATGGRRRGRGDSDDEGSIGSKRDTKVRISVSSLLLNFGVHVAIPDLTANAIVQTEAVRHVPYTEPKDQDHLLQMMRQQQRHLRRSQQFTQGVRRARSRRNDW